MKHRLGRQRQRVIKRLRRAKEVREAEDRKIAMRLEQANQVRAFLKSDVDVPKKYNSWKRSKTRGAMEPIVRLPLHGSVLCPAYFKTWNAHHVRWPN